MPQSTWRERWRINPPKGPSRARTYKPVLALPIHEDEGDLRGGGKGGDLVGREGEGGGDEWAGGAPASEACPHSSSLGLEGGGPGGEMRTGGERAGRRRGDREGRTAPSLFRGVEVGLVLFVLGGAGGGLCLGVKRMGGAASRLLALPWSRGGAVLGVWEGGVHRTILLRLLLHAVTGIITQSVLVIR